MSHTRVDIREVKFEGRRTTFIEINETRSEYHSFIAVVVVAAAKGKCKIEKSTQNKSVRERKRK